MRCRPSAVFRTPTAPAANGSEAAGQLHARHLHSRPTMIRGIHGLLYSTDAAATRAFFRDKVRLPGSDVGEGWWIFDFGEGDLGIHPVEDPDDAGLHDVSIYCSDIEGTVEELRSR